ncbi:MAG: hypothetical protein ABJA98_30190 [Acidobacteriota bacterium]
MADDVVQAGEHGDEPDPIANEQGVEPLKRDEFEQVKLLFDYTKFHIGIYLTGAASLIALMNTEIGKGIRLREWLVWVAVAFIGMAGLAGGIVASSLPHCRSLEDFWNRRVGPFRLQALRGETWTYVEHSAFWLAIVSVVVAFACRLPAPQKQANPPLQPTSGASMPK